MGPREIGASSMLDFDLEPSSRLISASSPETAGLGIARFRNKCRKTARIGSSGLPRAFLCVGVFYIYKPTAKQNLGILF
jgi:hypothetical protein